VWISRDNLLQFVEAHPSVKQLIDENLKKVGELREKCTELQASIERDLAMIEVYHKATSIESLRELARAQGWAGIQDEARELLLGRFFDDFGLRASEEANISLLAQQMVNNGDEMSPSSSSTAPLWNKYAPEFLRILDGELRSMREEVTAIGEELLQIDRKLISLLKEIRRRLSLDSGVPIEMATTLTFF
jgi:hypothetical protein